MAGESADIELNSIEIGSYGRRKLQNGVEYWYGVTWLFGIEVVPGTLNP